MSSNLKEARDAFHVAAQEYIRQFVKHMVEKSDHGEQAMTEEARRFFADVFVMIAANNAALSLCFGLGEPEFKELNESALGIIGELLKDVTLKAATCNIVPTIN